MHTYGAYLWCIHAILACVVNLTSLPHPRGRQCVLYPVRPKLLLKKKSDYTIPSTDFTKVPSGFSLCWAKAYHPSQLSTPCSQPLNSTECLFMTPACHRRSLLGAFRVPKDFLPQGSLWLISLRIENSQLLYLGVSEGMGRFYH